MKGCGRERSRERRLESVCVGGGGGKGVRVKSVAVGDIDKTVKLPCGAVKS